MEVVVHHPTSAQRWSVGRKWSGEEECSHPHFLAGSDWERGSVYLAITKEGEHTFPFRQF